MNAPVQFPAPRFDARSFLRGLRELQGAEAERFPKSIPPGGGIGDPESDRVLAYAFQALATDPHAQDDEERVEVIEGLINVHERHGRHAVAMRLRQWADTIHSTIGGSAA